MDKIMYKNVMLGSLVNDTNLEFISKSLNELFLITDIIYKHGHENKTNPKS